MKASKFTVAQQGPFYQFTLATVRTISQPALA